MSKTTKIKHDLEDVDALLEIFQILKDVASNNFYSAARRKARLEEFALAFVEFFRMVSLAKCTSPLVHPAVEEVGLVPITSEGGFMGDMTAKVIKQTIEETHRHKVSEIIAVGGKGGAKIKSLIGKKYEITIFADIEEKGLFRSTLDAKAHIIDQVKKNKFGRVYAIFPKAKTINLIKPAVVKLLPSEELLTKQKEIKDTLEKVILESHTDDIMEYLAEMWLTCRVFELLEDCVIAGYAAQSQQLESGLEKLKKDRKGLVLAFGKSKKSDIDKALREVFTASLMTGGGK
ncbi:MAG: F0F1 ATP synthase subunit gamma [Candidatus Omnitrophota bacterium]